MHEECNFWIQLQEIYLKKIIYNSRSDIYYKPELSNGEWCFPSMHHHLFKHTCTAVYKKCSILNESSEVNGICRQYQL